MKSELQLEYSRGFLDALSLLQSGINEIEKLISEENKLEAVCSLADFLYTMAAEEHVEKVKAHLPTLWTAESWLAEKKANELKAKTWSRTLKKNETPAAASQ